MLASLEGEVEYFLLLTCIANQRDPVAVPQLHPLIARSQRPHSILLPQDVCLQQLGSLHG